MIRVSTLLAALCAWSGLLPLPLAAQSSVEDFARLEVIDGGLTRRGTHRAALRVVLAEGWKTYWRAPGDSGIPPNILWDGSLNVGHVRVTWPTPEVFDQGGSRTIGYKHQMVLPLEISTTQPGQPVRLTGVFEFGLCEDICVPASLSFDMPLDETTPRSPAIAAALAARPFSAVEAGVTAATCRINPLASGSELETLVVMPSSGGDEVAVIEPGDAQVWASRTVAERQDDELRITTRVEHAAGTAVALDFQQVRITVLGRNHAVDIVGCSPAKGG